MGMIGGGIGAFIGDAHRRASRICNDFELVGGVFGNINRASNTCCLIFKSDKFT